MTRSLIVNADDFGQSPGIVAGVRRAHEEGVVTSASLMVRWPAAAAAADYARSRPGLSVGLHFDLGEWRYDDGEWPARYEVASRDDATAVREELDAPARGVRAADGPGSDPHRLAPARPPRRAGPHRRRRRRRSARHTGPRRDRHGPLHRRLLRPGREGPTGPGAPVDRGLRAPRGRPRPRRDRARLSPRDRRRHRLELRRSSARSNSRSCVPREPARPSSGPGSSSSRSTTSQPSWGYRSDANPRRRCHRLHRQPPGRAVPVRRPRGRRRRQPQHEQRREPPPPGASRRGSPSSRPMSAGPSTSADASTGSCTSRVPPRRRSTWPLPIETIEANTDGTRRLLELADRSGAGFVMASTSEVYGDPAVHPQPECVLGPREPDRPAERVRRIRNAWPRP